MAYWWVSQNQTYEQERAGGFLRAPNPTETGMVPFHGNNRNSVQPNDVILSYVGGKIVSVAVARSAAIASTRPTDLAIP